MQTKLTLRIDENVIEKAKRIFRRINVVNAKFAFTTKIIFTN